MISRMHNYNYETHIGGDRGFAALISVVLLASGVLVFSLTTLVAAVTFSDMTDRREMRIQAGLNLEVCLDTTELMVERDYYYIGTSTLPEFGCTVYVSRGAQNNYSIDALAELSSIRVIGGRQFQVVD